MSISDLTDLLTRLAVDVLGLLGLAVLYVRRHHGRELLMVYVCFNVGLFGAMAAITAGKFPAGVGFGLFGVLSIIRLRSQPFSVAEIGYFFLVLVLALVTGLSGRATALSIALTAFLLLAVFLADHPGLHPTVHQVRMTLDRAYPDTPTLRDIVAAQLHGEVIDVRILEVDAVRDTTRVAVRYRRFDHSPVTDFEPEPSEATE